jgi:hypothetical protein
VTYVQVGIRSIYIENMGNRIETFLPRILLSLLGKAHLLQSTGRECAHTLLHPSGHSAHQ